MLKPRGGNILLLIWFAAFGAVGVARAATPASASSEELVGNLPYSNQWVFDQKNSFLYLTLNSARLQQTSVSVGGYQTSWEQAAYSYPGVDFFTRLVGLGRAESKGIFRNFGFWGRYSLGAAVKHGTLTSTKTTATSSIEQSSLLILSSRLGLLLSFDRLDWLKIYAGYEVDPYYFRNQSDLSGGEFDGGNLLTAWVGGVHLPVLFSGKGSVLAEYRANQSRGGSGALVGNSKSVTAGVGVSF